MSRPSDNLISLFQASHGAQQEALQHGGDSPQWAAWLEAAAAFQQAVTDEAAVTPGTNRFKLEMAAKAAVLPPAADE